MSPITGNSVFIHNLLENSKGFQTKFLGPGRRFFVFPTTLTIMEDDVLIKWSEDGTNKTVWQVTKLVRRGNYPDKIYSGEMEDLVFHKRLTKKLAQKIREVDRDFIGERTR